MTIPLRLTKVLTLALGFFAMTGPLATDMYLASFTTITEDLNTGASFVQLTLTAFFFGMGLGQLFLGPLSDRFGRRPVLVIALSFFALSSIAVIFAPNIEVFITIRLIQGLSGSAAVVLSRAIAADLTTGVETVRALSLIAMLLGLGPIIAPPIGAVVSSFFGWRGVLATIAVLAVLMLLVAIFLVPESLPQERRQAAGFMANIKNFGGLFKKPRYILMTSAFVFGFAAMVSYVSASPFVGQKMLGMTQLQYSMAFAAGASALIIANTLNAFLVRRIPPIKLLITGTAIATTAALALVLMLSAGVLTWWAFMIFAFVMTTGAGFIMSNGSGLAMIEVAHNRGAGAALLGASQFLLGALVSPLVGVAGEASAVPMTTIIVVSLALVIAALVSYLRLPKPEL